MNEPDQNDIDLEHDEIVAAARKLPTDVAPRRDLWPDIEAAIAPPARRGWNRIFAQAAAVVLLIGGSSGITWLAMQQDATPIAEPTIEGLRFEPVTGSFGSQYHLGPEFLEARNNLASRLESELQRLPPQTRVDVEANLATIRAAIREINIALAEEPDNALLQGLLLSAYREELSLMRRVDGIATSAMRRSDI